MIKISKSKGILSNLKKILISSETNVVSYDESSRDKAIVDENNYDDSDISLSLDQAITNETQVNTEELKEFINSEVNIKIDEDTCFDVLDTKGNSYYTTGKRKILFKVEKYKFNYPVPKSTTLYYYPNLPIIQSLEYTTKTKTDKTKTTTIICNNQQVDVPIEYEYDEVTFKPYVSYSVALYNQKPSCLIDTSKGDFDINNLDIYTLENDSLFLIPFTMCFPKPAKVFYPSDYLVEVSIVNPIGGKVSPVCEFDSYYLYEVEVIIELTIAQSVNLNTINMDTLNVLNAKLDKPFGNTIFTQCELESVTEIDFSTLNTLNNSRISTVYLDYNIFDYLPNLSILNISGTNANQNTSSNFAHLNNLHKLTRLIAADNNFNNYNGFSILTNLVGSLTGLNLNNTSDLVNNISVLGVPDGDISPIMIFTNLIRLDLSGNKLSSLPASISSLSNLVNLNLSNNNLISLPTEFSSLTNLKSLDLSKNKIDDLSALYGLDNIEYLNIAGNTIDPNIIENLKVTILDFSNSNLNNQSLNTLKLASTVETLIISENHISDLTPLGEYNIEIIAKNQSFDYGTLNSQAGGIYILELEDFLLDEQGYVPCINYISDEGTCEPVESCDCMSIIWINLNPVTQAYFTFSNETNTFDGTVTVELTLTQA
ncbi:MAG: leucine-rich repeat domain-containing protein [Peptostreptococcaceae bacterium]